MRGRDIDSLTFFLLFLICFLVFFSAVVRLFSGDVLVLSLFWFFFCCCYCLGVLCCVLGRELVVFCLVFFSFFVCLFGLA